MPVKKSHTSRATKAFEKSLATAPRANTSCAFTWRGPRIDHAKPSCAPGNCAKPNSRHYDLEVIDVYQQPILARDGQIVATPTLSKNSPGRCAGSSATCPTPPACLSVWIWTRKAKPHFENCPPKILPAAPSRELAELRDRLAEAEETLRAIRTGEVDAVVVAGKQGPQVFTLEGAGHAYRVLIESMNEGALTLTATGVILYANHCFARMVKRPLEQVLGSSFHRLLSAADQAALRPLLKRPAKSGCKIQALLHAGDGSQLPAQISIRPLAKNGFNRAAIGMVVTDMTQARHNEELLRSLTHRLVQAQEAERRLVALELHDNITQHLCAVLARWAALANKLPAREKASQGEVMKLSEMLGQTAEEVQRIARNLRPSVLDELGLVPVLRATGTEFAERTGVSLKLACVPLTARLPADTSWRSTASSRKLWKMWRSTPAPATLPCV